MNSSLIYALKRNWLIIVGVSLLVGLVVFALSPEATTNEQFSASEAVTLDPSRNPGAAGLAQAALLVQQPVVSDAAEKRYGPDAGSSFASRISVSVDDKAFTISFSAVGSDPNEVERYVDSFARAFAEVLNSRTSGAFAEQVKAATTARDDAQKALNEFQLLNAAQLVVADPDPVLVSRQQQLIDAAGSANQRLNTVTQQANERSGGYNAVGVLPARSVARGSLSSASHPPVRGALAALLALAAMVGVVAVIERLAPRVAKREDIEAVVGAPVIAMIPMLKRGRTPQGRLGSQSFTGALAEAHRTLRVHLQFLRTVGGDESGASLGTVAIVSPTPGDGKSTSTAMLALAYVEVGTETLVLGCDFRRPTIQAYFGVSRSPGFTDRHNGADLPLTSLVNRDPATGVRVVPSGRTTSQPSFALADVRTMIEAGAAAGQQVIVDTAPVLVASETAQIASMVDHVVIVVRSGKTSTRALREAVLTLRLNHTEITGVVVIGSPESADYSYYYERYTNAKAGPPEPLARNGTE